jgi:hypothetical protein
MKVCPNNCAASGARQAGLEGLVDADAGAAHRILRAELRALLGGLPHGRDLADYAEGEGWVVGVGAAECQPIRLGTAFYDRGRCLPWAMATDCIVCEEWCPVSPKAIYVEEAQVIDADGQHKDC